MTQIYFWFGQGLLSKGPNFTCSVHEHQDPQYTNPTQWEMRYLSSKTAKLSIILQIITKLLIKMNKETLVFLCIKIIYYYLLFP